MPTPATRQPPPGTALVRVPADGPQWAARLPAAPTATVLTVTVNDASLGPVPVDDLIAGGYRIVGVVGPERGSIRCVDVLVPAHLREEYPEWWDALRSMAARVFDLRMGPVLAVLGEEIDRHLAASG